MKLHVATDQLLSIQLLRLQRASADKVLQHLKLSGCCSSAYEAEWRYSSEKQTIITVRLSNVLWLSASLTSSLAHCSGLSCLLSPLRTIVTARWLVRTSQIPSQPMIKNSSSSVRMACLNSGSAIRGEGEPRGNFKSQSPRARVTERAPLRYPSSIKPPDCSTLLRSASWLGL